MLQGDVTITLDMANLHCKYKAFCSEKIFGEECDLIFHWTIKLRSVQLIFEDYNLNIISNVNSNNYHNFVHYIRR